MELDFFKSLNYNCIDLSNSFSPGCCEKKVEPGVPPRRAFFVTL